MDTLKNMLDSISGNPQDAAAIVLGVIFALAFLFCSFISQVTKIEKTESLGEGAKDKLDTILGEVEVLRTELDATESVMSKDKVSEDLQ